MNTKLKRTPGIYIAGLNGSGASDIGLLLATTLGWSFVDLGQRVERALAAAAPAGSPKRQSESRRLETQTLRECVRAIGNGIPTVVALEGAAFTVQANRDVLTGSGVAVWLDCPAETALSCDAGESPAEMIARLQALATLKREAAAFAEIHLSVGDMDAHAVVAAIMAHSAIQ